MADETPPADLPVPCAIDAILFDAWQCVQDPAFPNDPTKRIWKRVRVPSAEVGSSSARQSADCGGGCEKKVALVSELATRGWRPADIERVLKAL